MFYKAPVRCLRLKSLMAIGISCCWLQSVSPAQTSTLSGKIMFTRMERDTSPGEIKWKVWLANEDGTSEKPVTECTPTHFIGIGAPPVLSPDDNLIAYYRNDEPNSGIWVWNINENKGWRAVEEIPLQRMSWAPDSKTIVFSTAMHHEIVRVDILGRHRQVLMPKEKKGGEFPQWSPRGDMIAFHVSGHISVLPAEGGEAKDLGEGIYPKWSSDGKKIAFFMIERLDDKKKVYSLWLMNSDGTAREELPVSFQRDETVEMLVFPVWSPDSRYLAFSANGNAFISDTQAKVTVRLNRDLYEELSPQDWSPSGKYLLVRDRAKQTYLFSLDGARVSYPIRDAELLDWTAAGNPDFMKTEQIKKEPEPVKTEIKKPVVPKKPDKPVKPKKPPKKKKKKK